MENFEEYLDVCFDLCEDYNLTIDEIKYNQEYFQECYESGLLEIDALVTLSEEII